MEGNSYNVPRYVQGTSTLVQWVYYTGTVHLCHTEGSTEISMGWNCTTSSSHCREGWCFGRNSSKESPYRIYGRMSTFLYVMYWDMRDESAWVPPSIWGKKIYQSTCFGTCTNTRKNCLEFLRDSGMPSAFESAGRSKFVQNKKKSFFVVTIIEHLLFVTAVCLS